MKPEEFTEKFEKAERINDFRAIDELFNSVKITGQESPAAELDLRYFRNLKSRGNFTKAAEQYRRINQKRLPPEIGV